MSWQACATKLVGRGEESARLRRLMTSGAPNGSGRMVLVVGEAGVGKSRLVREVSSWAKDSGVTVLSGRAVPSGEAYRPLVEALSGALRDRPLPDDGALRPYLPALASVLPDANLVASRPDPRGGVVLGEGMLRLVNALGGEKGALLVLEDLQWVDPDTVAILDYLAHAADVSSLRIIATTRDPAETPQQLLDLVAACQANVVTLERLGAGDVRDVVESCLQSPPPEDLVRFAVEHADGLPFLVEELLTGLAAVGALAPDGQLTGPLTTNVPSTFSATIHRRLTALDADARAVVDAAAVLGRRFDWRLLPEITGSPEGEVLKHLRMAVDSGLIEVEDGDAFRFRHALTRDAVRDELLPPQRKTIARAAAEVVERRAPEESDLTAGLWAAAGDEVRAASLYVRAGEQARGRGALHTADLLLSRAATLGDEPTRREAELALLGVLHESGDTDRALELGERLLEEGETGVRLTLAEVAAAADRWDVAEAELSALSAADVGDDPRAGVLAAGIALERGRPDEAVDIAEAALARAKEGDAWTVASQALVLIGRAARLSDVDAARTAFAAAERTARDHDLPVERVYALHELGTVDLLTEGSTTRLERARALALDAGVLRLAAICDVQQAASLLHRDADRALARAARSAAMARRLHLDRLRATALFFQAAAHAHRRDAEAMEQCVQEAESLAPGDLDVNAGIWGAVYAHVALLSDDRGTLAACLDRAMEYLRSSPTTTPAPTRALWALVRTLDGRDGEQARAEARSGNVNWENQALLGYADAVAAGRAGRSESAGLLLAQADAEMARCPWWRHRIRLLVAADALSDGWGDPVGWAREALPVFVRRGDDKLASRCREVLKMAGAPVPRTGRGDTPVPAPLRTHGVTSREMDILTLVAQGLTNGAIAQQLVLSPRTVETHVANLVAKTGVPGRAALIDLVISGEPED